MEADVIDINLGYVSVPPDSAFGPLGILPGNDALFADLEETAIKLIRNKPQLRNHAGLSIYYQWIKKAPKRQGKPQYGSVKRANPEFEFQTGYQFIVSIAAPMARFLGERQLEAAMFSLLVSIAIDTDEDGEPAAAIMGPDFTGFVEELREYGAWRPDLVAANREFKQLELG